MKKLKWGLSVVLSVAVISLVGCSGGGSGSTAVSGGETGTLSLSLTDTATGEYRAVYVTIQEVSVHQAETDAEEEKERENGWVTVAEPNRTYNLLKLINGVLEPLGIEQLKAGHYTQMRLVLGETPDDEPNILNQDHPYPNYIIYDDDQDTVQELKVPSGYKTGIKMVHGFDIMADQTTDLILDFDASRSVVTAGSSGQLLLKPTI